MPRNREYGRCRICKRYAEPNDPLSARGNHYGCSTARTTEAIVQLNRKDGPYYQRWLDRMTAAIVRETGGGGTPVS